MDPRDIPGYRLHRALSDLNSMDIEQLGDPERIRIAEATKPLEQVKLLALLTGTTVFLGIVSHLIADALPIGRGDHAIYPFQPLSPEQLRFALVRSNSRI